MKVIRLYFIYFSAVILGLSAFSNPIAAQNNAVAVSFRASQIGPLAPSTSAGVFSQANWNDINLGPQGGLSGNLVFQAINLNDSAGAPTGITMQTSHTTGFAANHGSLIGNSGDIQMMRGALYLRQADSGDIQLTNIPASLQNETYDVIVYYEATSQPRDISVTLNGETKLGDDATRFDGTFVEATSAEVDGNFIRFENVDAAALTLKVGTNISGQRAGLTGIQLVPASFLAPRIASFGSTPGNITSPTESIDLSWDVRNATTVTIDQGIGSVASNGTVQLTPGGDRTYQITATNSVGTTTREFSVFLVNAEVPNIVLFIVDDYGWQDTSYQFWTEETLWNELYRTPGMERLGSTGRAFTTAYSSGPVCTASRVSIMLGQAPVRHGTTFITGTRGNDSASLRSADQDLQGLVGEEQDRTLPRILSNRGYRSINVGKAHFGPSDPLLVGFDRNRLGNGSGSPIGNGSNRYQQILPDGTQVHLSEALTLAANEEIDDAVEDDVPFFLYMSHYAVHTPIITDPRFVDNYPTVSGTTQAMATLVEGMDKSLNDLMDHLEEKGIAEKTLIIFTSDHGGLAYRQGTSFYNDPPAPNRSFNWPLRGGKNDAYEGGIRIPMFVTWAKNDPNEPFQQALPIPAGTRESRPVIHTDLLPTILEITGYSSAIPEVVDGQAFTGYITGDESFVREDKFFWHAPNFWIGTTAEPESAMRKGRYKVLYTYQATGGIWELFDLESDLGEQVNLMDTNPEIGVPMARELIQYLDSEGANYPVRTSDNQELAPTLPSQATQVDSDGDGLNDAQEDPNLNGKVDPGETDPDNGNSDGDNVDDGQELALGLNSLDQTSFFSLTATEDVNGDFVLSWPSAPGASFTIRSSTDLSDWTNVVASGVTASSGTTTTFNLGQLSDAAIFYRVELEN